MLSCNALLRRLVTRVFCSDLLQAVTRSDRKLWTLILSPILWMHNEYNRAMTRLGSRPLVRIQAGSRLEAGGQGRLYRMQARNNLSCLYKPINPLWLYNKTNFQTSPLVINHTQFDLVRYKIKTRYSVYTNSFIYIFVLFTIHLILFGFSLLNPRMCFNFL